MHLPGAEDEDTNLTKMVLAIGLLLEEDGQSATADAIYESMKPIISSKIMGPADMKGVCLIALTVRAHPLLSLPWSSQSGLTCRIVNISLSPRRRGPGMAAPWHSC